MKLGWGMLGGGIAKLVDHFADPVKRLDRKIARAQDEKRKILSSGQSLAESNARLTELDNLIVQSKAERDRYLRRN